MRQLYIQTKSMKWSKLQLYSSLQKEEVMYLFALSLWDYVLLMRWMITFQDSGGTTEERSDAASFQRRVLNVLFL